MAVSVPQRVRGIEVAQIRAVATALDGADAESVLAMSKREDGTVYVRVDHTDRSTTRFIVGVESDVMPVDLFDGGPAR